MIFKISMILILTLLSFLFIQVQSSNFNVSVVQGKINETVNIISNKNTETIIFYDFFHTDENSVLQLQAAATFQSASSILLIIKNGFGIINAFKLENHFNESRLLAQRTVCPLATVTKDKNDYNRTVSVEVSSKSSQQIAIDISLYRIHDFYLQLNKMQNKVVSYNAPKVFLFEFPPDVDQITILVNSTDLTCLVFSVQDSKCPVHDSIANVRYSGSYQTLTTSGTMTLKSQDYSNRQFFLVFVIDVTDQSCLKPNSIININTKNSTKHRHKKISVLVKEVLPKTQYVLPILGAVSFYLLFFFGALCISYIYLRCAQKNMQIIEEEQTTINQLEDPSGYGTIDEVADMRTLYSRPHRTVSGHRHLDRESIDGSSVLSPSEINDDSFDSCSDVSTDPNLYRLNKKLVVSDLAKKHPALLNRKYFLYLWYLIVISVFYALPVVQLVLTYQKVVHETGNEDMCYYNFRCTRPLFMFSAFNNVISNIGYVLLGLLFILVTYRRDFLYNELKRYQCGIVNKGIPQYNGLFYAMGFALTMEGILSACYHICPSNDNFQFDTAFMYILACLCMIKVYQMRHPDVNATAHSFFMCMAIIIFVGVCGVVYNSRIFWIIFTLFYVILSIIISLEIYYVGRWRFSLTFPQRIYNRIIIDKWHCLIPTYRNRLIVILINYVLNFGIALYGGTVSPNNFASYFLAIFMFNLLLYFAFYIFMKIQHCEHFSILSIIYIVIAAVCWACAIYCFIKHPTDWQKSPAKSRELNSPCIFLEFYDIHDIWHFLSAMSMFFSFLALQTLDDNMFHLNRDSIPVF